jgi:cell wall-associated NlpC family hydrolase
MKKFLVFTLISLVSISYISFGVDKVESTPVLTSPIPTIEVKIEKDSSEAEKVETEKITRETVVRSILKESEKLLGLPYQAKGIAPWVLDCSGFTMYIFSKHGIKIPRTSGAQSEFGEKIKLEDAQPGDLMFFTGRDAHSGRVGHVAMVVSNNGGNIKMIHSCNRGIRYDDFPKIKYYKERFIKCVRIKIDPTLAKV